MKTESAEPQVLITRVFDAPRELVFKAWTDPAHLLRWHAPHGCTLTIVSFDARPGGGFHTCISNPSFGECWCKAVYLELVAPERIVYSVAACDKDGNLITSVAAGHAADWPAETVVTVTLEDLGGHTKLTLHQNVSEAVAKRTGAHPSWLQMLDRLAEALAKS